MLVFPPLSSTKRISTKQILKCIYYVIQIHLPLQLHSHQSREYEYECLLAPYDMKECFLYDRRCLILDRLQATAWQMHCWYDQDSYFDHFPLKRCPVFLKQWFRHFLFHWVLTWDSADHVSFAMEKTLCIYRAALWSSRTSSDSMEVGHRLLRYKKLVMER